MTGQRREVGYGLRAAGAFVASGEAETAAQEFFVALIARDRL